MIVTVRGSVYRSISDKPKYLETLVHIVETQDSRMLFTVSSLYLLTLLRYLETLVHIVEKHDPRILFTVSTAYIC